MQRITIIALALITVACASPIEKSQVERQVLIDSDIDSKQATENYRLGDEVSPSFYDILLKPYFADEGLNKAFTFTGQVKITVRAEKTGVSSIVLHANRLDITAWRVYPKNNVNQNMQKPPFLYNNVTHLLTLPLAGGIQQGIEYVLEFDYTGYLDNDMHGFYRTSYMDKGQKKWLGSTQLEQTEARRVLPCFDEPRFKATFSLKIERPTSFNPTLSNTLIQSSAVVPGTQKTRDTFKQTPRMSTYLLAFIVSEYTGRQNSKKDIGVFAPPLSYNQTEYSFNFTEKVLAQFDNFTNYPYLSVAEIEKLDQAAVPDFSAGAMENWGLLTYRDTAILFHPEHSSARNKQRVASVVAHEIAHQWFGDLVTCAWWDVTWLNEGFARYFEYFGTHWVENNWELDLQFVVDQVQGVFQMDALETTHPMTSTVNTPAEASAIFDSISYNKGGSVIRMMEHLIGSDTFKLSLQDYLKRNAFSSVTPESLWTAVQNRATVLQIARVMDPWTTQPGYPYINVTVNKDTVQITQKRFLLKNLTHNDTVMWPIPITFSTKASEFENTKPSDTHIFYKEDGQTKTIKLPVAPPTYFIVNNQQTGYYRVNYDTENWLKIKATLKSDKFLDIHVLNRAQIVDDLFNFARAGLLDYTFALDIVDYVQNEKSYIPWVSTFNGLGHLSRRLTTPDDVTLLKSYVLGVLNKIYAHLGYYPKADDKQTDIYNRVNVLNWLCKYEHEDCLKHTRAEWTKFVADPETYKVNPDHRQLVYCTGIREGNETHFELLWNRFTSTSVAHEQIVILSALGCTSNVTLLNRYLDLILTDVVRYQDKGTAFAAVVSGNAENVVVAQAYLEQNHLNWSNNFGFKKMQDVASAFSTIADRLTSQDNVNKLKSFVDNNKATLGEAAVKSIQKALTETEWQLDWAKQNGPKVRTYLTQKKNSASTTSFSVLLVLTSILSFYLVQ